MERFSPMNNTIYCTISLLCVKKKENTIIYSNTTCNVSYSGMVTCITYDLTRNYTFQHPLIATKTRSLLIATQNYSKCTVTTL